MKIVEINALCMLRFTHCVKLDARLTVRAGGGTDYGSKNERARRCSPGIAFAVACSARHSSERGC
jgi:hypothetical protein